MAASSSLYSELQLGHEGDIRLVKILSQSKDGDLSCELRTASLHEKPQYVAISYTWGPSTNEEAARGVTSTPTHSLLCNGHPTLVTENLHAFLVRAAKNTGSLATKYMWIDSICIDQSSPLERTSQVNLMAAIYHSAVTVVVWLGEEDEHTKGAFQLIQALGRHSDQELKTITPRNLNSSRTLQMVAPCGDVSFWRSVARLFQRRYFTRVWIIQEIMLATERLTVCGQYSVEWDHVVKVSKFLTITSWTRWICPSGMLAAVDSPQSSHAIPNLIEANKQTRDLDESKVMLYSLIRSRRFKATDPRDKVYALLGIAGDLITGKTRYSPVYGARSAAETYVLAAIQILRDSKDLLLLAQAEGDVFQTIPGLPSWVPDWSSNHVVGLGVTGYERFSAAGDKLPRILDIDEEKNTLMVFGKRLDTVTAISESKEEILRGKPFPRLLRMLCDLPRPYHTKQPASEVFWRTLFTDTGGAPPLHPAQKEYAQAFLSWFRTRLEETGEHLDSALLSKAREILATDGLDLSTAEAILSSYEDGQPNSPHDVLDASDYEATISHSPHLRPFLTRRGFFGVSSESLREDDEIWIAAGSRVPLALRPRSEQSPWRWGVVGGAYLHGFMHGEGHLLRTSEEFRMITLI